MAKLTINGNAQDIPVEEATPLLWALRDALGLTGTKFGCGIAYCGACTVLVDGQATRSCVMPLAALEGKQSGENGHTTGSALFGKACKRAWGSFRRCTGCASRQGIDYWCGNSWNAGR
jgi:isoquinoline 1-oxidoreductase alpha subunit